MKAGIVCGALMTGFKASPIDEERRYNQWKEVMSNYISDFDEKKFWGYGCNCLNLGDRPLSSPGYGFPQDALDRTCKQYKDCLKCARQTFGETCIHELEKYRFSIQDGEVTCTDNPASTNKAQEKGCRRKICECDKMLAKQYLQVKDQYDENLHKFYGDFDAEATCIRKSGGQPQCCGISTSYSVIYNAINAECCPSGEVVPIGSC